MSLELVKNEVLSIYEPYSVSDLPAGLIRLIFYP